MDYLSKFEELKSKELSLDLTRGKPSSDQLDLSNGLMSFSENDFLYDGVDIRNYGEIKGLDSCRELGAEILGCSKEYVWAGGNSSLSLMSQFMSFLFVEGIGEGPWNSKKRVSVLCPVPGYDRHFNLCEKFGINMIPVSLTGTGPDLEEVKRLIDSDDSIRGMWCVPKYSNPTGEIYSHQTIDGLLEIFSKTKNKTLIFWDNAYACHDIEDTIQQTPADQIAKKIGLENNLFQVGSTSKITLAGSGISFISSSKDNLYKFIDFRNAITPGPNKMNQGMHVKYFELVSIEQQMSELKKIIKPKFELVDHILEPLKDTGLCFYEKPTGGYFYSIDSAKSNADEVVQACSQLGLKLLPMGSCFPYGVDPDKKNIRLAPTFPDMASLERCVTIFKNVLKYLN